MTQAEKCPVCLNQVESTVAQWDKTKERDFREISCQRCGVFSISGTFSSMLDSGSLDGKGVTLRQRALASSLLRERAGQRFILDEYNYKSFFEARDIPMLEKADKLLLWVEEQQRDGKKADLDYTEDYLIARCWALNTEELLSIGHVLEQLDYVESKRSETTYRLTIKAAGWKHLETLRSPNQDSSQGFIAMWFAPEMDIVYNQAIDPAIKAAGYTPHRVDKGEHADKIDDEIIRQIRRSRFVVADATGHRGGVYYEAGFAHGLGLPVFLACKKGVDLHFDVRQYNCIFWEEDKLDAFKVALTRRIEAVLGRGPNPQENPHA